MNNDEATHLLVILLAVAIFCIVVLRRTEVENEEFSIGRLFGRGTKQASKAKPMNKFDTGVNWNAPGLPKEFLQVNHIPVYRPSMWQRAGNATKLTAKWAGNAIKNDPISILTTIPFLAMMFVPAGGSGSESGYGEEEGGSRGPSAAGSMSSVAVVVFGLFCCCMCMSMMMAMSSSS